MRRHKQRGFTLVELLITVGIIVILTGIAIMSYKEVVERAVDAKMQQEIIALEKALRLYHQKYKKMPNGRQDAISLCLTDDLSCGQAEQGWTGPSVRSVLPSLRTVGYNSPPTSFSPSLLGYDYDTFPSKLSDYRYSYETTPHYLDVPLYEYDNDTPVWRPRILDETKLISGPMVHYKSDGSFYFLYFQDHRRRECPIGRKVTLHPRWRGNGEHSACASHPLDQLRITPS